MKITWIGIAFLAFLMTACTHHVDNRYTSKCCQIYTDVPSCNPKTGCKDECTYCTPCDNYHECIDHVDKYSCEN